MAKSGAGKVLAETVYETIKEDILNSNLPPESVLDEVKLMARFKVSRTPVREALRRLISDGLVNMEPHRSAYVKPLSAEDIGDFFEAYTLVQRIVFILSAQRISSQQLEKATKLEERLENAFEAANTKAVRELNLQFHEAIANGCANTYLQSSYAKLLQDSTRLSSMLLKFRAETAWAEHVDGIRRDHHKILTALSKHDTVAIAQYSDQHVTFFKEQVYRAIQRITPKSAYLDPLRVAPRAAR